MVIGWIAVRETEVRVQGGGGGYLIVEFIANTQAAFIYEMTLKLKSRKQNRILDWRKRDEECEDRVSNTQQGALDRRNKDNSPGPHENF